MLEMRGKMAYPNRSTPAYKGGGLNNSRLSTEEHHKEMKETDKGKATERTNKRGDLEGGGLNNS